MLYVWVLILTSMTGTAFSGVVGNRAAREAGGGGNPSRGLEDGELARLLVQESRLSAVSGGANAATLHARRITPKSVFVAPSFCPNGKRPNGQCIEALKFNQTAQWNFLLQKLNSKYAPSSASSSSSSGGPLRISIPLGIMDNKQPRKPEPPARLEVTTTTEKTTTETTATTFREEESVMTTTTGQTTPPPTTYPPETTTDPPPTTTFPTTTTTVIPVSSSGSGSGSGCPDEADVEVRQVRAERAPANRPCPHHNQQQHRTVVIFEDDPEEDDDSSESIGLRRVVEEAEHRVIHRSGTQGFVRWPDDNHPQPYWWPTSYQRIRHYHWNHHHLHGRSR